MISKFQAPVDHILSHLDPSDPVHRCRDSLSDGENESEDEGADSPPFQEAGSNPRPLIPNLPELSVTAALSAYTHGLLRLIDFPSQPQHLVCLKCRRVQMNRNPLKISRHAESCNGIESSQEATLPPTGNEEQGRINKSERSLEMHSERLGFLDDELDPQDKELDAADEEYVALDEGDEENEYIPLTYSEEIEADQYPMHQESGNSLRQRFKELSAFLRTFPSSQDLTAFPERPIPLIPFFPLLDGFSCPSSGCPVACSRQETVMHHFSVTHKREQLSEPSPCKMQTLGSRGQYTGHFKVLEDQNGDRELDHINLDEAMRVEYAQVQAQFKHIEGLSTAESRNALLRKFSWDREFPTGHEDRVRFLNNRLCETSLLYKPRAQTIQQHLLHVYVYAYLGHTRRILATTQERYRLHFGNKLP